MKTRRNENKKKNNKGFSLVELIVVIAIMAVLVAVLAPQFTKYVDRSRQSNDATTVAGIVTAAQTGVADLTDYAIGAGKYTVTLNKTTAAVAKDGVAETASTGGKKMVDAIVNSCGALNTLKVTANKWGTVTVTITVSDTSTVTVTYANTKSDGTTADDTNAFATYIQGTPTTPSTP